MIFIVKGFRTIVFIFIIISTGRPSIEISTMLEPIIKKVS